ncbi:MAG: YihY/virulence factor BrkB family protein [Noviherbaspirillum sp.]|nr:YihY/virulence factor BrkB family protein [Noviherbaspirillum sp.]
MKTSHRVDKRELVPSLLLLGIAVFSSLQKRSDKKRAKALARAPMAKPVAQPTSGTEREAQARNAANERAAQKRDADPHPAADAKDLKKESYPKALFHVAISAAKEWSAHRASSKGAALALYTLFSLAPMLVLVLTIAGFFFGEDNVRELLLEQMSGLMGAQGADAIETILAGTRRDNDGLLAGIISAALVLISATSAFAELKDSLDELWEVPPSTESGLWAMVRERFLSFGLILVLAFMLLASLAVSTALAALDGLWGGGSTGTVLQAVSVVISHLVSFLIVTGLFAVIFRYLPAVKLVWKDVVIGAVITSVLFFIGKLLITTYIAKADISSSYGAAGSVVVLITWIYYSAQIFFYGSLFTHEYAMKLGSHAKGAGAQQAGETRQLAPAHSH